MMWHWGNDDGIKEKKGQKGMSGGGINKKKGQKKL